MARMTLVEAIVAGLREELERDPSIFMMGQDIGPMGGPLQSFRGLWDTYGPTGRMIDAPISEEAITAVCFGAAMAGKRPVFELMFSEFTTLVMGLFASEAGIAYKTDGVLKAPLVMRTKVGISPHRGHPEDFHSFFVHCPGVKVVMPATPYDAKGLMKAAIRDDNPVVFLEHMSLLHGRKEEVPETDYTIELGKADVKRSGRDVTIIAYGLMVSRALNAASMLAREGVEAEVVDLRTISPLDRTTILASVEKTGRAVIVHETWKTGGSGGEVAALIAEEGFPFLRGPVVRIAPPHLPVPFSLPLEKAFIPDEAQIIHGVRKALAPTPVS
ncbi:MAG: alpha-ketoacid dehydrogenase subunit beta [Burkholderiaceae bacterium]|nr:alpha-ketoacid dehydrogenase subunit beta [Burkholderiaceae bacterium]